MRKNGILNTEICRAISSLGHTDYFVIADSGLPIPKEAKVIDISLIKGIPGFKEVLEAVYEELVTESYIYTEEMEVYSLPTYEYMSRLLEGIPGKKVSHDQFKELLPRAKVIIRTGECTPYSNVILTGGVTF